MKKDVVIDINSKVIMFHKNHGYKVVTNKGDTICTRDPLSLPTLKIFFDSSRYGIYSYVLQAAREGFEIVGVINGYMTKRKLKNIFPEFSI